MPAAAPADVLVIGAGVIGLSTAYELLRAGRGVTVLELGSVGRGGASWAGGGILAPLQPEGLVGDLRELVRESLALYAPWCAALQADGGHDPEYEVCGLRLLQPYDHAAWTAWAAHAGLEAGLDGTALSLPGVAQVRSPRLLRALAAAVRARGGVILEHTPVLEVLGEPRVTGVRTASGVIEARQVVLCAGAWSRGLNPAATVAPVKGQMILLEGAAGELKPVLMRQGMYLIPRRDGGLVAGSTLETTGFDGEPSEAGREAILAAVRAFAPGFATRRVLAHWAGLRPAPQGGEPLIGPVEGRAGLWLNLGHHRLGITLAPGSAARLRGLMA